MLQKRCQPLLGQIMRRGFISRAPATVDSQADQVEASKQSQDVIDKIWEETESTKLGEVADQPLGRFE